MSPAETNGPDNVVVIKVVGAGGGGNNAVNGMVDQVQDIEFIAVNTDKPVLSQSKAHVKLQIGPKLTKGQGAGEDPEVGRKAAEESRQEIAKALENTHMVFIACGMGGGTGTGASPVIAEIARQSEILTVGVVTTPFKFEGARKMRQAEEGIRRLFEQVDALFVIPNERLKEVSEQKITFKNAFMVADEVLHKVVISIAELVKNTDFINLDFADVTAVMKNSGYSHMGVGHATGKDKAEIAAKMAIESPLMQTSIRGARGVIINVTGSSDLTLEDVYSASELVETAAHPDAQIMFGAGFDDSMEDEMRVTVIATRFEPDTLAQNAAKEPAQPETAAAIKPEELDELFAQQIQAAEAEKPASQMPAPAVPKSEPAKRVQEIDDDNPFEEIYKIFSK